MRFALAVVAASCIWGQTPEIQRAVIERLEKEADLFDRSAHRVAGIETLRQTLPKGTRIGRGPRGIETLLPELTREIVSEYGFLALDERGGWFKEVRHVLTIDGLRWNKAGKKGLESLAQQLTALDDKKKRSLLEKFEEFGLRGFITDLGQLILLFARGLLANYEIVYDSTDPDNLLVFRYQQLGGTDALTIYEGEQPLRQKLQGKIWVEPGEYLPVRISVDSVYMDKTEPIRDLSVVEYEKSRFGFVLPKRITHQQFIDQTLFVSDEFTYSGFKQVVPGKSR